MKVPPKRKGNHYHYLLQNADKTLNESPSEKEGKSVLDDGKVILSESLNESPSEKEGKYSAVAFMRSLMGPSMKVPPKRKGNRGIHGDSWGFP